MSEQGSRPRRFPVVAVIVVVAIVAVLVAGGVWAWKSFGPGNENALHQSKSYDGVTSLDITGNSGQITLIADGGDSVKVDRTLKWNKNKPHSAESLSDGRLTIKQKGCDGFSLGFNQCHIDYRIHLPAKTKVTANVDSGEVTTKGITGALNLHADSGDVTVDGSGAKLNVSADSGNVTGRNLKATRTVVKADSGDADLTYAKAPKEVTAEVDSGDVTLVVPDDGTRYDVNATVDSGDKTVGVKTGGSASHSIDMQADSGDVTIKYA